MEIQDLFIKHFQTLGKSFIKELINQKQQLDLVDLPIASSLITISRFVKRFSIRYGKYLEDVINYFLESQGAINLKTNSDFKNYDLCFQLNNVLYIGEIKLKDNHDSTKRQGQINNLINKSKKAQYWSQQIKVLIYFIDHKQTKNKQYYQNEFKQTNFDFNIYYGNEFFQALNLTKQWNDFLIHLLNFHQLLKTSDLLYQIITIDLDQSQKQLIKQIFNNLNNFVPILRS